MKTWRKIVSILLVLAIVAGMSFIAAKAFPIVAKGYMIYVEAMNERGLDERVAELRSNGRYVKLEYISQEYLTRVVAAEDHRFYSHLGIDPIGIARAMYHNLKLGYAAEGGSTITQQLAKNLVLDDEHSLSRKVAELFAAFDIERSYSKDEILEMYCNITYFGEDCYGIFEASTYYGVLPKELDADEAAALVYTLPAPSVRNPACAA